MMGKYHLLANTLLYGALIGQSAMAATEVYHSPVAPIIDGVVDPQWRAFSWFPIDAVIVGAPPEPSDFSGRFKVSWHGDHLYLLAQIQDDILTDSHPNPTDNYWNDDCLEVFLDPDGSGGDHLYSHNAFAYHIALDNQVVDLGRREGEVVLFNQHIYNRWQRSSSPPYALIWEAKIGFYADTNHELFAMSLNSGMKFGLMLAYCDADGQPERELFIGSQSITTGNNDKNIGYKTADVFTKMRLNPATPPALKNLNNIKNSKLIK